MEESPPLYRVLFVCVGNTCRSPLAAAALRQVLGEDGRRVRIASAGVTAADGAAASANAIEVAARRGLDLRGHRARRLTAEMLEDADLVLALDGSEIEVVRGLNPAAAARAHLISEVGAGAPSGAGVPDPVGGSVVAYEECLERITEHVERIAPIVGREAGIRVEAEGASGDKGVV